MFSSYTLSYNGSLTPIHTLTFAILVAYIITITQVSSSSLSEVLMKPFLNALPVRAFTKALTGRSFLNDPNRVIHL